MRANRPQSSTRKTILRYLVVVVASAGFWAVAGSAAVADTVYQPPAGTWNGERVYLSRACHDASDEIPGGPCIPNEGCEGAADTTYNENVRSRDIIQAATYGAGARENFLERGYIVVIGNGTVRENISNSNGRDIAVHMPVHSNAFGRGLRCASNDRSLFGTEGLYRYDRQRRCSSTIVSRIGPESPGTDDRIVPRTDLGELNEVNAVSCYLEAEYHIWGRGVNWLRDSDDWASYLLGFVVDDFLDYPFLP